MYVNLLDTTSGTQRVMGVVRLRGRQFVYEGSIPPRIQTLLHELLDLDRGEPEALLRTLPQHISGSYLRAELVER